MRPFQQHPEFYNKPIHLTDWQQAAPMEVLDNFFRAYDLSGLREALHLLVHTALTSENPDFDEAEPRDHIAYLIHNVEVMLEAAWLIHQRSER